eukprot:2742357-Rhodomonas_salina.1
MGAMAVAVGAHGLFVEVYPPPAPPPCSPSFPRSLPPSTHPSSPLTLYAARMVLSGAASVRNAPACGVLCSLRPALRYGLCRTEPLAFCPLVLGNACGGAVLTSGVVLCGTE